MAREDSGVSAVLHCQLVYSYRLSNEKTRAKTASIARFPCLTDDDGDLRMFHRAKAHTAAFATHLGLFPASSPPMQRKGHQLSGPRHI